MQTQKNDFKLQPIPKKGENNLKTKKNQSPSLKEIQNV